MELRNNSAAERTAHPASPAGPWQVKQTYTRSSLLPRWIVTHPRDGALMHPATIRRGPRLRTWNSAEAAQKIADEWNGRYAASAAAAALARAQHAPA